MAMIVLCSDLVASVLSGVLLCLPTSTLCRDTAQIKSSPESRIVVILIVATSFVQFVSDHKEFFTSPRTAVGRSRRNRRGGGEGEGGGVQEGGI